MQPRYLWSGVSIAAMWLAVLFVGVFGGNYRSEGLHTTMELPIVLIVALFAMIATILVAKWGFRD